MAQRYQLIVLAIAFVAAASAGVVPVAPVVQPVALHAAKVVDPNHDPHPQYSFSYDVQDQLTGDVKNQHETRDGDVVQGSYSLVEADGTRRTVDYTADPVNGFNAVVHKEPANVPVKAVAAAVQAVHPSPAHLLHAPIHPVYQHATAPAALVHAAPAPVPVYHATAAAPAYHPASPLVHVGHYAAATAPYVHHYPGAYAAPVYATHRR